MDSSSTPCPYKETCLKLQISPVRELQIVNDPLIKDQVDRNDYAKRLIFAQGCQLFHSTIRQSPEKVQLEEFQVFPPQFQITTFAVNSFAPDKILVISKNVGKVISISTTPGQCTECTHSLSPVLPLQKWITACIWIDIDRFVTLTGQNEVILWIWHANVKKVEQEVTVEYKVPAIYSGKLYLSNNNGERTLESVLVCSGTVFGAIHVWNVRQCKPNVLCVVENHQGPVCSIDLCFTQNYLITTGDDRSAKLYNVSFEDGLAVKLDLRLELYGHTGRVYQAVVTSNGKHVVTSSNDGTVCIWKRKEHNENPEMEIVRCWTSNGGAPIRTMVYDPEIDVLVTGGDDGSVRRWNVGFLSEDAAKGDETMTLFTESLQPGWGNPRILLLANEKTVIGASHSPDLKIFVHGEMGNHASRVLWTAPEEFGNYTSLAFSPCKTMLALGGSTGLFLLTKVFFNPDLNLQHDTDLRLQLQGKISSVIWITDSRMVVSTRQALYFITIHFNTESPQKLVSKPISISTSSISRSSNPQITAAVIMSTSHINESKTSIEYLVLGDENGILRVYENNLKEGKLKLQLEVPKWHAKYGISSLRLWRNRIVSTGRDCYVKMFTISTCERCDGEISVQLEDVHTIRTPFEWIDDTYLHSDSSGDLLCVGFRETRFVLYSLLTRIELAEIDCGGAHRSYDWRLSTQPNSSGDLSVTLAFIRNRQILHTAVQVFDWLNPIKIGVPNHKINCAVSLSAQAVEQKQSQQFIFAIGGEDTLITILCYETNPTIPGSTVKLHFIEDLSGHSSSVRALTFAPYSSVEQEVYGEDGLDCGWLFSGGGRSELIVWHLKVRPGVPEVRYERMQMVTLTMYTSSTGRKYGAGDDNGERLDVRVLDIKWDRRKDFMVYAACSDGTVNVLKFNKTSKRRPLHHYMILRCDAAIQHAVSRVVLSTDFHEDIHFQVHGTTTNGTFGRWTCVTETVVHFQPDFLNKSPITSAERVSFPDVSCALVIGCDDGSLQLYNLQQMGLRMRLQHINAGIHMSTVSDIKPLKLAGCSNLTRLVTCSVDGVVAIWKYTINTTDGQQRLECISELRSGIHDCQNLLLTPWGDTICLGDGISVIDLDLEVIEEK